MKLYRVTHIQKTGPRHEDILWLGNPVEKWKLPAEKVMQFLQNKTHVFYIERFDSISTLAIFESSTGQVCLRSTSGGQWNDLLLSLPEFPTEAQEST